jgi:hypothetical protein
MENNLLQIRVDAEHTTLRVVLAVLFVVLAILIFVIGSTLLRDSSTNFIVGGVALVSSALLSRLLDPWLKQRWPSGRIVELSAGGASLKKQQTVEVQIDGSAGAQVLVWSFKINRRSSVPKGWYVVACALQQDDRYLPIYSFASPEQRTALDAIATFPELAREQKGKDESLRLAGEQRRLRLAEEHRWRDGAEMGLEDFQDTLKQILTQYPLWTL